MTDDGIDRNLLMRIFLGEAEEDLAEMETSLLALEAAPGDAEILNTIFRGAHTVKGNAATMGIDAVVELAHMVEDLLDELRAGRYLVTPGIVTLLLHCVDRLKTMIAAVAADPESVGGADPQLLEALRKTIATGEYSGGAIDHAPASPAPEKRTDTLRVSLRKLDTMMNLTGEIAIARGRMRELISRMEEPSRDLLETQDLLDRLCSELQEHVTGVRMVALEPVFQQQVRIARDLARAAGKVVQVQFEGQDVELDTAVVDQIRDPIVHMVRNSIDHGIETPDRRSYEGKARTGTILLRAFRDGGMVVIEVADDGAGLDPQRILARARAVGLVGEDERLPNDQLFALIFAPGFSTAAEVTEISGRGVGMDVVQRNITGLGGTVSVDSVLGHGTTVTIRLPLTLAIIDALSVGVGEQTFIIPIDAVVECLDVPERELQAKASGVMEVRGRAVPFIRLAPFLGVEQTSLARRNLLLVRDGDRQVGVIVDRLNSRTQAVIKPLWKPLPRLHAIAGATILGNGSVALIVDLPRLVRQQLKEIA